MSAWKHLTESVMQIPACLAAIVIRNNTVRRQSLQTAELRPCLEMFGIPQELLHKVFMITAEADRAIVNEPNGKQIDYGLCVGTAIDIVTEIDFHAMADRPAFEIAVDAFDRFDQEIGSAMDITNRVDARIGRR